MVTAERVTEDIDLALKQWSGFCIQARTSHGEPGFVTKFRNIGPIQITQVLRPRSKLLGTLGAQTVFSSIVDTGRSYRKPLWLPDPDAAAHQGVRSIVRTDNFGVRDALRSLGDPSFHGFRSQPPEAELLGEADMLLQGAGIDNMSDRSLPFPVNFLRHALVL
jgi:hypothetical protein